MSNIYVDFPLDETLKTALFCKHLANDITIVFIIIRYTHLFIYKKIKTQKSKIAIKQLAFPLFFVNLQIDTLIKQSGLW